MIRSGEGRGGGRPGRGRKGKDREGGVRRRPGVCASARRLPGLPAAPRPAPAPAPTAARGARAASAPPPPEPRASASCARSPARAGGEGTGLCGRAGTREAHPLAPQPGLSPSSPGSAPAAGGRPQGRAFQLFFEGLACPPRRKMPTEAAAGVGKRPPPRFRHLRNSGRFARIRDAPAADTLIKSCLSIFAAANANDEILCTEPS